MLPKAQVLSSPSCKRRSQKKSKDNIIWEAEAGGKGGKERGKKETSYSSNTGNIESIKKKKRPKRDWIWLGWAGREWKERNGFGQHIRVWRLSISVCK